MTDTNQTPPTPATDEPDNRGAPESPVKPNNAGKHEGAPATGGDGSKGAGGPDGFGTGD
jgi:hypothetical protein